MRICSIRGSNLASLAGEFFVDFEHGPLAGTGLFGITGPTGAGKSTLLDAMFLALFDATPRLSSKGGAAIGLESEEEKQRLGAFDVRSLLRKGAGEGFAQVEFIGRDGRRYRAKWSVRRARGHVDGAFQNQTVELRDVADDQVLGGKKMETLEAIEQRLGLDFEQFRRSVVLAQGEFAAFLRAKEDERAALLEQMTGTGLYSAVSIKAFERARDEEATLAKLQGDRAATAPLPPEERLKLDEAHQQLASVLESTRTRLAEAEATVAWFTTLARLTTEATTAQQALAHTAQAQEAAAHRAAALQRLRTAHEVRPQYEAWTGATEHARLAREAVSPAAEALTKTTHSLQTSRQLQASTGAARTQAEQALEAVQEPLKAARVLDTQADTKQKEHASLGALAAQKRLDAQQGAAAHREATKALLALQAHREAVEMKLQRLAPLQGLVTGWPTTRGILLNIKGRLAEGKTAPPDLDLSSAAAMAEARRRRDAAQQREAQAQRAADEARAAFDAFDRQALEREARGLELRGRTLATLQRVREEWQRSSQSVQSEAAEVARLQQQAQEATARAETARAAQATTRTQLDSTETVEREFKKAAGLSAHRAELRDGHPCPLCGATEHPTAKESSVIETRLRELTAEAALLKASMDRLSAEQVEHQLAANTASEAARLHTRSVEEARSAAAQREAEWQAEASHVAGAPPPLISDESAAGWLSQRREDLQSAVVVLTQRQDQGATLEAAERDAAKNLDLERTGHLIAERSFGVEESLESVSASLERIEGWRRRFLTEAPAFLAAMETDVLARQEAEAAQQQLTVDQEAMLQTQREAAKDLERHQAELQQQTARVEACATELTALLTARHELLGGRSADEVERSLKQARDARQAEAQQAEQTLRLRETELHKATEALGVAQSQAGLQAEHVARAFATLEEATRSRNLTLEELARLLVASVQAMEAEHQALQQLKQAHQDAETLHQDREQKRTAHETSPRPEGDELSAQAAVAACTAAADASLKEQGALLEQQRQDDARLVKDASVGTQIAQQELRVATWGRLRDVIGSADGKKFRKYAQGLTFEALLEQSNFHLKDLARRYELMRVPGHDLELQLIDHDLGDEARSVASLSGGESFLVSLALALGLSSLGAAGARLDSLFIDEGFGSLDAKTLDVALDVLDALQASGRKVGIITHVPGLESRLGAQVRVKRTGAGQSSVEVGF